MGRDGRRGLIVAALLALLAVAPPPRSRRAPGDPPSRAEFVEDADRICEVPFRKGLRLLGRADVQSGQGDYVPAGKKTIRAGRMFLEVNERIAAMTPPTADARLIEAWLNGTHDGFAQVVKSGRKLEGQAPEGREPDAEARPAHHPPREQEGRSPRLQLLRVARHVSVTPSAPRATLRGSRSDVWRLRADYPHFLTTPPPGEHASERSRGSPAPSTIS